MLTKLIKIIGVLLLVVIISAVVFVSVFDANEYKPEIIAQVEKATGRDFSIEGDIGLTLYPWIGLKLETTRLGNAKGFSQNSFASLEQLNVKVNVLPLLKKEIEINKIQLKGLTLSLEVNKDGKTNWEDLAQSKKTAKATPEPVAGNSDTQENNQASQSSEPNSSASNSSGEASTSKPFALESLKVEGFEFVGATINIIDKAKGNTSTVSDLNLQTGAIQFDEPVEVQFSAHVENSKPVLDSQIEMTTALTFNQQFSLFTLKDFLLTVAMKANDMVQQDVELVVKAQTNIDMDKQLINVEALQIDVLDVQTIMDMRITQFSQAPVIDGNIKVKEFNAKSLSKKLAVVLPEMAEKDALSKVSLTTQLKMEQQQLQLNHLNVQLDESTLTGWVRIPNLDKQQIRYDLLLDKINLNSYMPPASTSTATTENETASGNENANETASVSKSNQPKNATGKMAEAKAVGDEKIELPAEMLRSLDVAGVFAIDALHVQEFDVSQLSITTKAKNGDVNIKPIKLNVLEGSVNASARLDVRKSTPVYSTNVKIKDVQAGPLVNPSLKNMMGDKPMYLVGKVNVTAAVKSQANTVNGLKKKAKGKVTLDMNATSVKGFDPEYFARSSVADYLEAKGLGDQASVRGQYEPRKVTVFDTIHDTANIANGKVTTKDFLMNSERVVIKANGAANIMNNTMDMTSSITLPRGKTVVEKLLTKPLYVRVHGPFDALQYDVDTNKLSDNVNGMLEAEAKQKVNKELDKQKEKLEKKIEKKFGDELKNKFKGLF